MLNDIKGNQDSIHDIETVKIPEAETFRGQVKVVGVIALTIWIGGFAYTFNHKQDSMLEHDRIHDKISTNTSDLSNMKGDQKALIVEVKNLVKEVERSNGLTERFLEILIDQGPPHKERGITP